MYAIEHLDFGTVPNFSAKERHAILAHMLSQGIWQITFHSNEKPPTTWICTRDQSLVPDWAHACMETASNDNAVVDGFLSVFLPSMDAWLPLSTKLVASIELLDAPS